MHSLLIRIIELFISKRIHIGILAFVMTIYYARLLNISLGGPVLPLISALIVWSAYLENIVTDVCEDSHNINVPHGLSPVIEKGLVPLEKWYLLFYFLAMFLAFNVNMVCFVLTLLGILIFSSYVQRWIPGPLGWRRFKDFFIIKNILPPLGWVMAIGVMPWMVASIEMTAECFILLFIIFLFSFREEIKFDIPDIDGDRHAGIKTMPNVLGEARTRQILTLINIGLITALCLLFLTSLHLSAWSETNILLKQALPLLIAFAYDARFTHQLFHLKKKELCNIGIIWWVFLLILFLFITYPYNIFIFIVLRFSGTWLALPSVNRNISKLRLKIEQLFS